MTAAGSQALAVLPLAARFRASIDAVYREMVKFGAVGVVAFVTDLGLFNLLRTGVFGVAGPLDGKPLTAKTVSAIVATIVAWLGNRYWTFRRRRRASRRRELFLFVLMNAGGLGIALACLGFSHYVLGLTSALADNIAGNVVGLGLGTLFRFWTYRKFVFTEQRPDEVELPPVPLGDVPVPLADVPVQVPVDQRVVVDLRHRPLGDEVTAGMLDEDLALAEELLAIDGVTTSPRDR